MKWRLESGEGELRVEEGRLVLELGRPAGLGDSASHDYFYLSLSKNDLKASVEMVTRVLWDATPPSRMARSTKMGIKRLVSLWTDKSG